MSDNQNPTIINVIVQGEKALLEAYHTLPTSSKYIINENLIDAIKMLPEDNEAIEEYASNIITESFNQEVILDDEETEEELAKNDMDVEETEENEEDIETQMLNAIAALTNLLFFIKGDSEKFPAILKLIDEEDKYECKSISVTDTGIVFYFLELPISE